MKTSLLITFSSFLVMSCSDNPKKSGADRNLEASEQIKNIGIEKPGKMLREEILATECGMEFKNFFHRFTNDSLFQKSRIEFPLKCYLYDMFGDDYDKPEIKPIAYKDYEFMDIGEYDQRKKEKGYDTYGLKFKEKGDTMICMHFGIDNGIHISFEFQKIKNCWKLILIKDESA